MDAGVIPLVFLPRDFLSDVLLGGGVRKGFDGNVL